MFLLDAFLVPTIFGSIGVFLLVLMLLVFLLLYSQAKLVASGDVKIVINGDEEKPLITSAGGTILSMLGENNILLPSACGGGGTCSMCKCQVFEGGGDVLPTEVDYLSRKEQQENWRLGCQVKVRGDMNIKIPDEVFGIKKWECEVVSNYNVASFIKELHVRLPEGESLDFEAGGYIQIDVPPTTVEFKDMDITPHPELNKPDGEFKDEWDKFELWDLTMKSDEVVNRAYSMANHPAEGNVVTLDIRIATPPWDRAKNKWADVNPGVCSSFTFGCKPGDKVTISGPYGEFFIKDTKKEMIYVGGGAGMAPLRSHIFHLFHTLQTTDRQIQFWYGGRSKRELFYVDYFREIEKNFPNFKFYIALSEPLEEDNWKVKDGLDGEGDGFVGFVHQCLIDNYLGAHKEPEEVEFYFCGPPLMNEAVINMLDDFGVPEEHIAFDDFGV